MTTLAADQQLTLEASRQRTRMSKILRLIRRNPLGAAAAHKWPVKWLKRIFGVLLLVFATRMVWSLS